MHTKIDGFPIMDSILCQGPFLNHPMPFINQVSLRRMKRLLLRHCLQQFAHKQTWPHLDFKISAFDIFDRNPEGFYTFVLTALIGSGQSSPRALLCADYPDGCCHHCRISAKGLDEVTSDSFCMGGRHSCSNVHHSGALPHFHETVDHSPRFLHSPQDFKKSEKKPVFNVGPARKWTKPRCPLRKPLGPCATNSV